MMAYLLPGYRHRLGNALIRFVLRAVFWLAVVGVFLPPHSGPSATDPAKVRQTFSAASDALSDMGLICRKQGEACIAPSHTLTVLGQTAQAGAKTVYDLLAKHLGGLTTSNSEPTPPSPGRSTLSPVDRQVPWRASPTYKAPDPKPAA